MRNIAEGDIRTLIHYLTNENLDAGADDAMRYLSDSQHCIYEWFSRRSAK